MADPVDQRDLSYHLRLPADLKDRIKAAAEASSRSLSAEIVSALMQAYPSEPPPSDIAKRFVRHLSMLTPRLRNEALSLIREQVEWQDRDSHS